MKAKNKMLDMMGDNLNLIYKVQDSCKYNLKKRILGILNNN